jgi:hypothetical protein
MNNVAQYVSHFYIGRNSDSHISFSSGDTNDNNVDGNDDNDDNNEDDDDVVEDSFWHRDFDHCKLVLYT